MNHAISAYIIAGIGWAMFDLHTNEHGGTTFGRLAFNFAIWPVAAMINLYPYCPFCGWPVTDCFCEESDDD